MRLRVTPAESSPGDYGSKPGLSITTVLMTLLSVATISVLIYHYWRAIPAFGPQPANLDLALDEMQFRGQQINGLSLNGSWTYSLPGYYAGPFYVWAMALGGALGSSVLGPEWYYYSGYVFTQLLVLCATLWSVRQAHRWLKREWAVGFCVAILFMVTDASNRSGGGFVPALFFPSWGPTVATGMFVAALMSFVVYAMSRKGLGGLVLFSGLAVQTHGAVEVPVAIMLLFPLYDVVRDSWGRSVRESFRKLRWVIGAVVLGWGVIIIHVALDGINILLPTSGVISKGGSAGEKLQAASAQIAFGGDWISVLIPCAVSLVALGAGFRWRKFARVSVVAVLMSVWAVFALVAFSFSDAGAHASVWYSASAYLLVGAGFVLAVGATLQRLLAPRAGGWGNVVGGALALLITINPFGYSFTPLDPAQSSMRADNAESMRSIVVNLPQGNLNFLITRETREESEPVIAAAQAYGHRVCRIQIYSGAPGESAVDEFTCPYGELENGRWLLVQDANDGFRYKGRLIVEGRVSESVWQVLEVPKNTLEFDGG